MKCECDRYDMQLNQFVTCGNDADLVVDPLMFDVYDETRYVWLCPQCLEERWYEI